MDPIDISLICNYTVCVRIFCGRSSGGEYHCLHDSFNCVRTIHSEVHNQLLRSVQEYIWKIPLGRQKSQSHAPQRRFNLVQFNLPIPTNPPLKVTMNDYTILSVECIQMSADCLTPTEKITPNYKRKLHLFSLVNT